MDVTSLGRRDSWDGVQFADASLPYLPIATAEIQGYVYDAKRRLAELARTRYREGVVGYLEVLDAERSLFSAEQALLQVRRAEVANLVSLFVALGGGQLE